MTGITADFDGQTIITTFEMRPGTAVDLMEALSAACAEVIRQRPGVLGAALHMNDAQTRIANHSKWRRREDFRAMLRPPGCASGTGRSPGCACVLSQSCLRCWGCIAATPEPAVVHCAPVPWQVIATVQPVEMLDGRVGDGTGVFGQPDVHGNSAPTVRFRSKRAPEGDAAAGGTEVKSLVVPQL